MKAHRKKFVDKKLIFKLRIFAALFCIMIFIAIYDTARYYINPWEAIGTLLCGSVAGYFLGRAFNVIWDEEAGKAIRKMDVLNIAVIVLYLLFALSRRWIFHHWFTGNELSAFIICLSAGITLGRYLSLRRRIHKVLKQQELY
jgi:hypothetical protein